MKYIGEKKGKGEWKRGRREGRTGGKEEGRRGKIGRIMI
jgi:hypothetical protein